MEDVLSDLQRCLDQAQRISYWVAILNALTSKEALSRQSLQKYSEDLQVQNLKIFFNSANPGNLSQ